MKELTEQEFQDRAAAIARARKIFIPHLTKDIGIAFELYQEIFAERERELLLDTITGGKRPRTFLDRFIRPTCPECKEPLYLRIIREPKGPRNRKGWKTCWECLGPSCPYEQYSKKTLQKQVKRLRRKKNGR